MMKKQLFKQGFTLIELLVVIAIIGILASVVLASLNSARTKGQDASIKSTINNMRAQAELYYDNNSNSYAGTPTLCSSTELTQALAQVNNQNGSATAYCNSNDSAYIISSALNAGGYYCVDSTGASDSVATGTAPSTGTACP